ENQIKELVPSAKITSKVQNVFNGFAVSNISENEVNQLEFLPEVKKVYPNYEVHAFLMDSVPLINADDVWQLQDDLDRNITGEGITIGIIDTGVDYTHPDLGGCFGEGCKVVDGWDFVNNDSNPMDDMGHGTHVAAIAAGNGTLKGIAPDAGIYAYKVLNSSGSGWDFDIIVAIERATDPNQDEDFSDHLDVINLSLGGSGNPDDPMSQAIDNAVDAGVVAVIAAGNDGPSANTIGSPGTARKAITVGATYKKDYEGEYWDTYPRVDQITPFSSRGPVVWNGGVLVKPDVVAPGAIICAARFDSIFPEGEHPYYYPCLDEEHVQLAGTSMSAPIVAGSAALIKQAHNNWNPEQIKIVLRTTAIDTENDIYTQGYGRINVLAAVNSTNPITVNLEPIGVLSGQAQISGEVSGNDFQYYKLEYGKGLYPVSWIEFFRDYYLPLEGNPLGTLNTTLLDNGKYVLKLTALDNNGNSYVDQIITKVNNDDSLFNLAKVQGFFYPIQPFVLGNVFGNSEKEIIGVDFSFDAPKIWVWDKDGNVLNGWPKIVDYWDFATGKIAYPPVTADIDNDGIDEVLLIGGRMVYAWNGDGSLVSGFPINVDQENLCSQEDIHFPCDTFRFSHFSVDDLDNDGTKEIVSILTFAFPELYGLTEPEKILGVLYVFDSQGNIKTTKILNCINNYSPAIGDIDNDGEKEIVVSCNNNNGAKVIVLDKNGNILNGWPVSLSVSTYAAPVLGDIDNDGNLEILIKTQTNLTVLNGIGEIIFDTKIASPYSEVSLGDITDDDFPEIIVRGGNSAIEQTFEKLWILDKEGNIIVSDADNTSSTAPLQSIIADVDDDELNEILIWNKDELKIFDQNLNLKTSLFTNGFSNIGGVIVDDLENNGFLDIVGVDGAGNLFKWKDIAPVSGNWTDWPQFQHDAQHTGLYTKSFSVPVVLSPVHDGYITFDEATNSFEVNSN
ncbi:S8 family serine peptidase, partial [Candidatus Micrarchaeota archaeon]|nr:S8 family serine peptidase [Candidatus Micrarchaeota archaeon]